MNHTNFIVHKYIRITHTERIVCTKFRFRYRSKNNFVGPPK